MARKLDISAVGPRTLAIHAGEAPDPATGASSPNIVMSSTFVTEKPEGVRISTHFYNSESDIDACVDALVEWRETLLL